MAALAHAAGALDRWWFAPTTRYQLGIFRVLLVGWLAWFYSERLFARLAGALERPVEFHDPASIAEWLALPLPLSAQAVAWLTRLAALLALLALVGLCTRVALVALALVNLTLGFAANAWGYTAHATALPALVLCILACAPGATCFSLDALLLRGLARKRGWTLPEHAPELLPRRPRSIWPVRTVLVLLCLLYFSAGASKLRYAGWQWTDGQTLAFYLSGGSLRGPGETQRFIGARDATPAQAFRDGFGIVDHAYVASPTPLGVWLSRQHAVLVVLSWMSLLFELLFPLALLGRRASHLALLAGVGFHLGISLTLSINFTSYLVCYALFVDWRALGEATLRTTRRWLGPRALQSSPALLLTNTSE